MHLTRESEYALLGLAVLALRPEHDTVPLAEIADGKALPPTFLAKIFQKLARHGLVTAGRGPGSGYALARPPEAITMRQIFEAVEGPRVLQRCLLWQGHCGDRNPCPLHYRLKGFRPALESVLNGITLAEYVAESSRASRAAVPSRPGRLS